MNRVERSFMQNLWDFFCALKLTMFILISLAVISIIGTVIPQAPNIPEEYLETLSQTKMQLYTKLGFFDMYHSWWFILLLCLLTANLIACSIKRLPHILKMITQPVTIMGNDLEKSLANVSIIKTTADVDLLHGSIAKFMQDEFVAPVTTEGNGDFHLFAQKSAWARLSVYFVHLSVIIIFIGAIIGSLFGFKGFVNVMEGGNVSQVMSRADKQIDLGFGIRCESFSVAYYDTGAPREFKSILTVLENGKPVAGYERIPVIVNDPLSYKGITFYQSSYGKLGSYAFTVTNPDGKNPVPLTVSNNSSVKLPDGSSMHVLEATPDVSPYQPGLSGPAANVEVHTPKGDTKSMVVYANYPDLNRQNASQIGGQLLQFNGGEERMYTGLQVAKDPGVWVVWLGCFLMVVGICGAFFASHRRIWVRIQNGTVTVGGHASKNQSAFQLFFDGFEAKLRKHLSSEDYR